MVVAPEWMDGRLVRPLREIKLIAVGLTPFPANSAATATAKAGSSGPVDAADVIRQLDEVEAEVRAEIVRDLDDVERELLAGYDLGDPIDDLEHEIRAEKGRWDVGDMQTARTWRDRERTHEARRWHRENERGYRLARYV